MLVPSLSTETSNSFLLPDGSIRVENALEAINYETAAGDWAPVDNSLVDAAGSTYAVENAEAAYRVQIPEDAGRHPIKFSTDGVWVTLKMRGLDGTPDVSDATATFDDVEGASSVELEAQGDSVKESITLDVPPVNAPVFTYDISASAGLTPNLSNSGAIEFTDSSSVVKAVIPAGFMYDSATPAPALSQSVGYELSRVGTGWILEVRPSMEWLTASERIYPVVVDPTIGRPDLPQSIDCVLKSQAPTTSFCANGNEFIRVGKDASGNRFRGLLDFNTNAIPAGSTINDAYVRMSVGANNSTNGSAQSYGLGRTANAFTNAATWNTYNGSNGWASGNPGAPVGTLSSININASSGLVTFPGLSSIVQGWIDTPSTHTGLVVVPQHNVAHLIAFKPRLADVPPELIVTYTAPPPASSHNPPDISASQTRCSDPGYNNTGRVAVSANNPNNYAAPLQLTLNGQSQSWASVAAGASVSTEFTGLPKGTLNGVGSLGSPVDASRGYSVTVAECPLIPYEPDAPQDTFPETAARALPSEFAGSGSGRVDSLSASSQSLPGGSGYTASSVGKTSWRTATTASGTSGPIAMRATPVLLGEDECTGGSCEEDTRPAAGADADGDSFAARLVGPATSTTPSSSAFQIGLTRTADSANTPGGSHNDIDVQVSYASFEKAYGGNWSDRLIVEAFPACRETTPQVAACRVSVPVPSVNDPTTKSLAFTATPPLNSGEAVPTGQTQAAMQNCFSPARYYGASSAPTPDATEWDGDDDSQDEEALGKYSANERDESSGYDDGDGADDTYLDTKDPNAPQPAQSRAAWELSTNGSDGALCRGLVYQVRAGAGGYAMAAASNGSNGGGTSGGGSASSAPSALETSAGWQVGDGSGDFRWSYPFTMPTGQAGEAPQMSMGYSSAVVDGLVGDSPAQASQLGLGWSMEPGHISRTYASCYDDSSPTNRDLSGNLCWRTQGGTVVNDLNLVLEGRSTRIIKDGTSGAYRLQDDAGWKVEVGSGGSNGFVADQGAPLPDNADGNDEFFKLTSPDGTRYFFGYGTTSVWTVPVRGNNSGEPCNGQSITATACIQGWQWNLDRVVDADGNRVKYTYASQQNKYKTNGSLVSYTAAGQLATIQYGFPRPTPAPENESMSPQVVVQVETVDRCVAAINWTKNQDGFNTDRPDCGQADAGGSQRQWPDVPTDLLCMNKTAANCDNTSPAFFSTKLYANLKTYRGPNLQTPGGTQNTPPTDIYVFKYSMPDPDGTPGAGDQKPDEADLLLQAVQHVPRDNSTTKPTSYALPGVLFDYKPLANRVVAEGNSDKLLKKYRLDKVTNELGGTTEVTYGQQNRCTKAMVDNFSAFNSTGDCFTPRRPGENGGRLAWYHKYLVTRLQLGDRALRLDGATNEPSLGKMRQYRYTYRGEPGWRFDGESKNTPLKYRSWSDWRGYQTTLIRTMKVNRTNPSTPTNTAKSLRRVVVFRGFYGSRVNNSGQKYVTGYTSNDATTGYRRGYVSTVEQGPAGDRNLRDRNSLRGKIAEETVLEPPEEAFCTSGQQSPCKAKWITRTYHGFEIYRSALSSHGLAANFTGERMTRMHTRVTRGNAQNGTSNDRRHTIERTFHEGGTSHRGLLLGVVTELTDKGASTTAKPGGDRNICTLTTWAGNTTNDKWIRVPTRVRVLDQQTGDTCTQPVSDITNKYDGYSSAAAQPDTSITRGQLTRVETAASSAAQPNLPAIVTSTRYDNYGRIIGTTDGKNFDTTTSYLSSSNTTGCGFDDLPCQVTVTTNRSQVVSKLEPRRGLPEEVTDFGNPAASANDDAKTTTTYDGYGRVLTVTSPKLQGTGKTSISYDYAVYGSNTVNGYQPAQIKTTSQRAGAGAGATTDVSYAYMDGWGRTIEAQSLQADGSGRVASATGYDELGTPYLSVPVIANADQPGSGLINANPANAVRWNQTLTDAAGRVTEVEHRNGANSIRYTDRATQQGDRTITTARAGGNDVTGTTVTTVDGWGRTSRVEQHLTAATVDQPPTAQAPATAASYTYDGNNNLTDISADISGTRLWHYEYDLAGRRVATSDPDTGTTSATFDANSNQVTTRNPVDGILKTIYDDQDRPTKQFKLLNGTGPEPGDCVDPPATQTDCSPIAKWTYDAATNGDGRPAVSTSYTHLGTFTESVDGYDLNGNPLQQTYDYYPTDSGRVTFSNSQTYNDADMVTSTTYGAVANLAAMTVSTSFGPDAAVATMTATQTGQPSTNLLTATYDKAGRPLRALSEGADASRHLNREYAWDNATGRLTRVGGSAFGTLDYSYDTIGNVGSVLASNLYKNAPPNYVNSAWCYGYDGLNRISYAMTGRAGECLVAPDTTQLVGASETRFYGYSKDRLSSVNTYVPDTAGDAAVSNYAYQGAGPHHATQITTDVELEATPRNTALHYDPVGRADQISTDAGVATYSYNPTGTLKSVTGPDLNSDSDITVLDSDYAYDTAGMRVGLRERYKLVRGFTTNLTYYAGGTEVSIANGGAAQARRVFTSPGGKPLATVFGQGTSTTPSAPTWTFSLGDAQNSVRFVRGATTDTRPTYRPFGEQIANGGNDRRGYLNKPVDRTGDVRLDQRNYPARLNVLTSPDALFNVDDPDSLNPYAYARNNPVSLMDPSGLEPRPWHNPDYNEETDGPANPYGDTGLGESTLMGSSYGVPINYNTDTPAQIAAAERIYDILGTQYQSTAPDLPPRSTRDWIGLGVGLGITVVGGAACTAGTAGFGLAVCFGATGAAGSLAENAISDSGDHSASGYVKAAVLGGALGAGTAGLGSAGRGLLATTGRGAGGSIARALPSFPRALAGGAADTHVYFGLVNGKPVYAGITNNFARRQAQHGSRFVLDQITTAPVTRGQARAIEQALIVRNPGFQNKINSISPKHPYYQEAVGWGEAWLVQNGL
ncbi:DNRLRE domain-containing protein [Nocardioides flavescens]|uniref:DNRLRE domain-containing protein n=1 Tax=Nocardioides flavescens TaxID=2691959 RepID=A0A6L7F0P2_9ACTN|nr:DNRLRE domain-containing protein [Nocardioides flavescens]